MSKSLSPDIFHLSVLSVIKELFKVLELRDSSQPRPVSYVIRYKTYFRVELKGKFSFSYFREILLWKFTKKRKFCESSKKFNFFS